MTTPVSAMTKIVEILTPLPSEERARVIRAAMVLLGETALGGTSSERSADIATVDTKGLPPRARMWMKQNGVTDEELQQVFHIAEGDVEIIAPHMPGRNKKEQTYAAYILTGIAQLLASGAPTFQDKTARALCSSAGCYDPANHSTHIRDRSNEFTGTKDKGWTLTAPGLKRAAEIIKELQRRPT